MDYSNTIVQLNKFPPDKYNVLVPVTTMQVASNLQRITVSEVQLDTRQNPENSGPSKDIYFEKSANAYAITKVGGMKLAAAANISIVETNPGRTEGCQRCIEMARATGKPRVCGTCEHVHDVAVTVTVRVPEPSGGFRLMKATREIDCTLEAARMKGGTGVQQYQRFLPFRTAMAESKAFMRAIRAALGLAGTYKYEDLKKPFVVARVVPNLDAPEIWPAATSSLWVCCLRCPPLSNRRRSRPRNRQRKSRPIPMRSLGSCRGMRPRRSRLTPGAIRAGTTDGETTLPLHLSRNPGLSGSSAPGVAGRSPAGRPAAGGSGRWRTSPGTVSGHLDGSSARSAKRPRKAEDADEQRKY